MLDSKFEFSKKSKKQIANILLKYPKHQRFSAIMPVLTLAQEQNSGYLTHEIIEYVAKYLQVSAMAIFEIASFYSMYNLTVVGKYHIQFCQSVVCFVLDVQSLYDYCKEITNTQGKSVSDDGLFSVVKVQCLGACINAPVIKVNNHFYENITKEKLLSLVTKLKNDTDLSSAVNFVESA